MTGCVIEGCRPFANWLDIWRGEGYKARTPSARSFRSLPIGDYENCKKCIARHSSDVDTGVSWRPNGSSV